MIVTTVKGGMEEITVGELLSLTEGKSSLMARQFRESVQVFVNNSELHTTLTCQRSDLDEVRKENADFRVQPEPEMDDQTDLC